MFRLLLIEIGFQYVSSLSRINKTVLHGEYGDEEKITHMVPRLYTNVPSRNWYIRTYASMMNLDYG